MYVYRFVGSGPVFIDGSWISRFNDELYNLLTYETIVRMDDDALAKNVSSRSLLGTDAEVDPK